MAQWLVPENKEREDPKVRKTEPNEPPGVKTDTIEFPPKPGNAFIVLHMNHKVQCPSSKHPAW
jgi:hypothetical protein